MTRVLVTGASSGIGEATAKYLAEQGAEVICVARREELLQKVCEYHPDRMWSVPCDLTDLENIEKIFEVIREKSGPLTGLVHCAGINRDMPVRTNDAHIMKRVMDTNYGAFVELGKYFCKKKYSEEGSSIVAISSTASYNYAKGMCTYSSSKAALNAAVMIMAKEFVKRKIRVNAILPNFVNTEMTKRSMDYNKGIGEGQPLGIIESEYIAYLVEFLLSDKAKYMTGCLIPVTGG